jgi:glycosyltransferase involved in cell wall biosynthesis
MYKSHRIAVVAPARNEAAFIGRVIGTMPDFVDSIIVVDDGSEDGTAEVAASTGDPRVVVLRNPTPLGVGGATLAGYRKALELRSDVIAKMDGDGQMRPEYLCQLLDAVIDEGYACGKGNRFLAARSLGEMPRHRLLGNIALTFMTKLMSGYWQIFDPQNGYIVVRAAVLRGVDLDRIHRGYFFENDMLLHLNLLDARVKDVPVPARYGEEESGINAWRTGVTFPLLMVGRFFYRIYRKYVLLDFSPIALFLFLGCGLFLWGALFGTYVWIRSSVTQHAATTGTVMFSVLPLILGFQLLLQGIVLDIQQTPK